MKDEAPNHHTEWSGNQLHWQTAESSNETLPAGEYSYLFAFILLADASYQTEAGGIPMAGRLG